MKSSSRSHPDGLQKKPEITFIRGNCGSLWACKDGNIGGRIYTTGDEIFEKEKRKEWIRKHRKENCKMDHDAFRDFVNRHEWISEKNDAAFFPHEYVAMTKQLGEEWPLFPEIARFIREKGFVAEYNRLGSNWYYIVDDYYYWTLDKNVEDTDLINRAKLRDFEFVDVDGRKVVRRSENG